MDGRMLLFTQKVFVNLLIGRCKLYQNPHDFAQMRGNAMRADRTWDKVSLYEKLFAGILRYK